MPSRILLIPILLLLGLAAYFTFMVDEDYAIYMLAPIIIGAVVFIMSPQIDWYWFEKNPPKLDPMEKKLLIKKVKIFQNLSVEEKKRLESRVALFNFSKSYQEMAMPNVPEDLKIMTAITACQLTLGFEEYLLESYEKVIVYPHPFPSPQYPENFHICESFEEDGVLLFEVKNFLHGFIKPKQYFNIALYEISRVVNRELELKELPSLSTLILNDLLALSGTNEEDLKKYIGLPELDSKAIAVVQFIENPARMHKTYPALFEEIQSMLNYKKEWFEGIV